MKKGILIDPIIPKDGVAGLDAVRGLLASHIRLTTLLEPDTLVHIQMVDWVEKDWDKEYPNDDFENQQAVFLTSYWDKEYP